MKQRMNRHISRLVLASLISANFTPGVAYAQRSQGGALESLFGLSASSAGSYRTSSFGGYGTSSVLCDDLFYPVDVDLVVPGSDPAMLDGILRILVERSLGKYVLTYDRHGKEFALKITQIKDTEKPDNALFLEEMKHAHSLRLKETLIIALQKIESEFREWLNSRLPDPNLPTPSPTIEPEDPLLKEDPNAGYSVPRILNREEIEKLETLTKKYIAENVDIEEALAKREELLRIAKESAKIVPQDSEMQAIAKKLGYDDYSSMPRNQQYLTALQIKRGKMNIFQRFAFRSSVVLNLMRALRTSDGRMLGFLTKAGKNYSQRDHLNFLMTNRQLDTLTSHWQLHEILIALSQNENLKSISDLFETPEVRPEIKLYQEGAMRPEILIDNIKNKIYYQSSTDPSSPNATATLPDLADPNVTPGAMKIELKIPGPGGADPATFKNSRTGAGVSDLFFEALNRMLHATKRLRDLGGRGRGDPGRIIELEQTYDKALKELDLQNKMLEAVKTGKQLSSAELTKLKRHRNYQKKLVDRLTRELAGYYADFIEAFMLYKMFANVNRGFLTIFDDDESIHPIPFPAFVFVQNEQLLKKWEDVYQRALSGGGSDKLARRELVAFMKDIFGRTRKFIRMIDNASATAYGVRYVDTPSGQEFKHLLKRSFVEVATLTAKFFWKVGTLPSQVLPKSKPAEADSSATAPEFGINTPPGSILDGEQTAQAQDNSAIETIGKRTVDTVFWTALGTAIAANGDQWATTLLQFIGLGGP